MTVEQNDIEFTGTESIEELEAWLDSQEDFEGDDDFPQSADDDNQDENNQAEEQHEADTTAAPATVDAELSETDEQQVIESKNGGHAIPYSVLEDERKEKQLLRQQLDELIKKQDESSQTQAAYDKAQRVIEHLNNQLTGMGAEPQELPEDIEVTDDDVKSLGEDYPEFGRVLTGQQNEIKKLKRLLEQKTQGQTAAQSAQPKVDIGEIIQSIPELAKMQQAGGEDWQRAIELDDQLIVDPNWQGRSQAERFQEVTRRVIESRNTANNAINDSRSRATAAHEQSAEIADRAIADAKNRLPNSPSEMGNSNNHLPSDSERMATASDAEMQRMMMDLSDEEINDLLLSM